MFKSIVFFISVFFITSAFGNVDCMSYKKNPVVKIIRPGWEKRVVQPLKIMDLYHGNVVATLIDNYDIVADINKLPDNSGFCVGIKNINATIGYTEFLVKIDMRHKLNSCSYNVVLSHEDEHINSYLSIIDDFQRDIKKSVYAAANSVTPVFINSEQDIDFAIDELNSKLQNHPDLILIKQKISAAEELRNAKVDENKAHYDELKKCNKK